MNSIHKDMITIGEPVSRRVMRLNGAIISEKWVRGVICYISEDTIGIAYNDRSKEMVRIKSNDWKKGF
jgi:hypothetical protein